MTCFVSPASDEARHSSSGTKAKSDILEERGLVRRSTGLEERDQSPLEKNEYNSIENALEQLDS